MTIPAGIGTFPHDKLAGAARWNRWYAMRPIETLTGFLLLIFVLLATGPASSQAQVRNRVDNRGTQFRLAFLHTNGYDDNPRFFIDVWCAKATRDV